MKNWPSVTPERERRARMHAGYEPAHTGKRRFGEMLRLAASQPKTCDGATAAFHQLGRAWHWMESERLTTVEHRALLQAYSRVQKPVIAAVKACDRRGSQYGKGKYKRRLRATAEPLQWGVTQKVHGWRTR